MLRRRSILIALASLWLMVGVVYLWAAWQQKQRLNLSATAGGQYPYLVYAQKVARQGLPAVYGDRNRMPLYPSLLALAYDEDWDTFVDRSSWFAIASSVVVLIGIGGLTYLTLPVCSATALVMTAAVCVFIHTASFVQAELAYYGLLYACWLIMCRLIHRPHWNWAVTGGILSALAYLTKASALAILPACLLVMCLGAVAAWRHGDSKEGTTRDAVPDGPARTGRYLVCAAVTTLVFLSLIYPYIRDNKERFGRYFYNVNSTFFMWCDSWSEAKAFADEFNLGERFPETPASEIPSPINYWRMHSVGHMLKRLAYGAKALAALGVEGTYFKYLAATVLFCAVTAVCRRQQAGRPSERSRKASTDSNLESFAASEGDGRHASPHSADFIHSGYRLVGMFCGLFFVGYLLAFTWYAQVAYGDRFLLSLLLPAMFTVLWASDRLSRGLPPLSCCGRRIRWNEAFAIVLTVCLLVEGGTAAAGTLYKPSDEFVRFYYNESRERQLSGELEEAARGFSGVIQLDPQFAPAYHGLGMTALLSGRPGEAVAPFREAVRLDPNSADAHNSLGSALIQIGRINEAISEFELATQLDTDFVMAWYNLGGSYCLAGQLAKAEAARQRLQTLHPSLAGQLGQLISSSDPAADR